MFDAIFWIIIGLFIGWNLPQPTWANYVQSIVMGWITKLSNMIKKGE